MIWVAAAGVVMNGVIALLLYRAGRDVNIRSALLHEIGDTVSTAAVIVGGWVIMATGRYWIDSVLSVAIGALILWSGFGIVRETLNILLEGTPRGMKLEQSKRHAVGRGSERCTRSACVEHRVGDASAVLPHLDRGYPAFGQRADSARLKGMPAARFSDPPHHHPVRACGLRSGPRMRDSRGRRSAPAQTLDKLH